MARELGLEVNFGIIVCCDSHHCTVGTQDPVQLPIMGHCTSRTVTSEFFLLGESQVLEIIRRGPPVEDGGHRMAVYHGYLLDKRVKSFLS